MPTIITHIATSEIMLKRGQRQKVKPGILVLLGMSEAHRILSALATVERRCAMTKTVKSFIILSSASCTTASLSESSALVAWAPHKE